MSTKKRFGNMRVKIKRYVMGTQPHKPGYSGARCTVHASNYYAVSRSCTKGHLDAGISQEKASTRVRECTKRHTTYNAAAIHYAATREAAKSTSGTSPPHDSNTQGVQ